MLVLDDNRIIPYGDESGETKLLTQLYDSDVWIGQSQMAEPSSIILAGIRICVTNMVSKYSVAEKPTIKNFLMVHQKNHILSELNGLYLYLNTLVPDRYAVKALLLVISHYGWFFKSGMYLHNNLTSSCPCGGCLDE